MEPYGTALPALAGQKPSVAGQKPKWRHREREQLSPRKCLKTGVASFPPGNQTTDNRPSSLIETRHNNRLSVQRTTAESLT